MLGKFMMKLMCFSSSLLIFGTANAVTYAENFSGKTTQMDWKALGAACMTASGNGRNNTGTYTSIPFCSMSPPDPAGYGALRLTSNSTGQTGGILSNFSFPLSDGIQITFTTYTYNGSQDGPAGNGADGIAFMLTDGSAPMPVTTGGGGGSLGYSCSNAATVYEGMTNAYLGLGIDEWGNFLNAASNTNTGIINTNSSFYPDKTYSHGSNSWYSGSLAGVLGDSTGMEYQPMRIGLRGAGNTTWDWLVTQNPDYYKPYENNPDYKAYLVKQACSAGVYQARAGDTNLPYNYRAIDNGYYVLSASIVSNTGKSRVNSDGSSNTGVFPITYKLSISPAGRLNFSFSRDNGLYQQVLTDYQITTNNGPLPPSFRFGFSSSTGGSYNIHEITCFQAAPQTSNSSAGSNTVTGELQIGSQLYVASYTQDGWWGSVQAIPITVSDTGTIGISTAPNWDANCVLTGGACASTGKGTSATAPQPGGNTTGSARVLLTSNSTKGTGGGIPFQTGSLDSSETTALGSSAAATTLAWLRGDRSKEQSWTPPGTLRARAGVLGDIINSSPTWLGPPPTGTYPDTFKDLINNTATSPENQPYSAYVTASAARQAVVYVGSNDGFVHGFRTGAADASASSPGNDGQEVLGFMPSGQLLRYAAGLTNPQYSHNYLVDATPTAGDLFYNNSWHTWLVGGVGSAGQEIYALDVTKPANFSESNAASLVMGDWTAANTPTLDHLNCTVGTPAIVRLHNGQWAIIFGNGLPDAVSANCNQRAGTFTAGVYIGLVNPASGTIGSFTFLDTSVGNSTSRNGIAYISPVDADGDHITDYVYAGDVLGNVWRFDLTSATPANWSVSKFGGASGKPLFTTPSGQPITTAPIVAKVMTDTSKTALPRMMVFFGTGQLKPATTGGSAAYAMGMPQTFYGIWDWDWSQTSWKTNFVNLSGSPPTITTGHLLSQSITSSAAGYRALSKTQQVCWADLATCGSSPQYGWYVDFPDKNEQVIYNPMALGGAIIVNTAEPPVVNAQACNPGQQTGWTMAFNLATGGGFDQDFFDGGAGIHESAVGSPLTFDYKGDTYMAAQTVSNKPIVRRIHTPPLPPPDPSDSPPGNGGPVSPGRVSWREIRH